MIRRKSVTVLVAVVVFVLLVVPSAFVGDRVPDSDQSNWASPSVGTCTYPNPQYRVQMDIGVGYGMDIGQTRQLIVDKVAHVEGVLPSRPVDALYSEMGDSAMMFRVRWWIESHAGTRRIFDRVHTSLQHAHDQAGIEMPYPTHGLDLQIEPETADRLSQALREPAE